MVSGWRARKNTFASSNEEPLSKHGSRSEKLKKRVVKISAKGTTANIKVRINP